MRNKKLLTLAAVAGLAVGGVSVASAASAQGYGSEDASTAEATTTEASTSDAGTIVLTQDPDGSESEAPADGRRGGERQGRRGHGGGCNLDDAAAAIGVDEADLRAALDTGDSIADVAEANGVDPADVIDALVDAKAEQLAEKVDEGRLTQDEADEKLAESEARITDRVNGVDRGGDAETDA